MIAGLARKAAISGRVCTQTVMLDQPPDLAKIVCMASSAALRAFWHAISWFMGTVEPL